ncbi:ChbG/HpnK family deacetylase [Providencia sp. PROV188]|uniref:ChbG/HpnK family deacetylase n=1 Tax=Providencia sp. PROV188 TaxID=2939731 RepID=UPI0022DDAE31|nr:ChbG/HpnK family deacetylase [Providencia sp. PROV188]WBM60753.1 ChbG/HpnK family deacetylase [Providencia sp. PROV188]
MFIINADDYGHSERVNNAIIHCFNKRLIDSATLMANMPGTEHAIKNNDNFSLGCHLNLMEGKPLNSNCLNYRELTDSNGELNLNLSRNSFFANKCIINQIKIELDHQISFLFDHKIKLTHLDSHHHTHTIPIIYRIVHELALKYKLRIRLPRYTGSHKLHKVLYKKILCIYMKKNGLNFTDKFINYNEMDSFKNNKEMIEVMVHPDLKDNNTIYCNTTNLIIDRL